MVGRRFGRLVVIEQAESQMYPCGASQRRWMCKCDCGNSAIVTTRALTSGDTRSCGCFKNEVTRGINLSHGKSRTRLYEVWKQMKKRCENPSDISYKYYGALGVKVCDEWKASYPAFERWMLEHGYDENAKRSESTIDRINPTMGYNPENCRVVDWYVQANNKRKNNARIG